MSSPVRSACVLVGRVECLGDLARDRQDLGDRERPPCGNVSSGQAVRQCASIDELEDQAAYAVTLFDSVDGGNAGMAERRQHSGFTLEACQPVGVLGERRRQDLDCHVTGEARITRGTPRPFRPPRSGRRSRTIRYVYRAVAPSRAIIVSTMPRRQTGPQRVYDHT